MSVLDRGLRDQGCNGPWRHALILSSPLLSNKIVSDLQESVAFDPIIAMVAHLLSKNRLLLLMPICRRMSLFEWAFDVDVGCRFRHYHCHGFTFAFEKGAAVLEADRQEDVLFGGRCAGF